MRSKFARKLLYCIIYSSFQICKKNNNNNELLPVFSFKKSQRKLIYRILPNTFQFNYLGLKKLPVPELLVENWPPEDCDLPLASPLLTQPPILKNKVV